MSKENIKQDSLSFGVFEQHFNSIFDEIGFACKEEKNTSPLLKVVLQWMDHNNAIIYANFRFLSEENFGDVSKLYEEVSNSMDNKNWLKSRDHAGLKKTVDNGGFNIRCSNTVH